MAPQQQQFQLPPIPAESVREGSRWRHHRPVAEEVAAWFKGQPLDENMAHDDYVAGIVLIPQGVKTEYRDDQGRKYERYEDTFTPYVQVGTRIAYFHALARAQANVISVIRPVKIPLIDDRSSAYYNANMEAGYWWHVIGGENPVRYLCCTMRVAHYEREAYLTAPLDTNGERILPPALLEGRSTKQVAGGPDINQLAKAQTSAIGRALGVAGILVLGTGVASAEDMMELGGAVGVLPTEGQPTLPGLPPVAAGAPQPPPADPAAAAEQMRGRIREMQSMMQAETPKAWSTFAAWYGERAKQEGWDVSAGLSLLNSEALKVVMSKMERDHAAALANPEQLNDETQVEA